MFVWRMVIVSVRMVPHQIQMRIDWKQLAFFHTPSQGATRSDLKDKENAKHVNEQSHGKQS